MNKPSPKKRSQSENHIHNAIKPKLNPKIGCSNRKREAIHLPAIFDIREEEKVEGMAWVRVQLEFLSHL